MLCYFFDSFLAFKLQGLESTVLSFPTGLAAVQFLVIFGKNETFPKPLITKRTEK